MLKLNNVLEQAQTIAIGGHLHPDGDCVGSCMAMYQYITNKYSDKKVSVYLEEIPVSFLRIVGTDQIRHTIPEDENYDLFICLDCGDANRLGFSMPLFERAAHTICIDHHISNESFADENYIIPEASSTSELVYDLIDKKEITKELAEALYLGIVHDTGVFQYSCTAPSTLRAAAALLETGINASDLIQETYYAISYSQLQILGRALTESYLLLDGKCIVSCVDRKMMDFYQVNPKDLDGIVSQIRNTKGTEVAVFLYELDENVYKVSLRSGEQIDVSVVAKTFGGGGHKKAAGLTMPGPVQDIVKKIMTEVEKQMRS